ncbi:hypothetical protein D9M68_20420 [compost metagenome]
MSTSNQFLADEFAALSKAFLSKGFYFRLIMTDDLINQGEVRQRARDKVVHGDDKFFYGCSLEKSLQKRVDDLVRVHKQDVLALVELSEAERTALGIEITEDPKIKAYLVTLTACGMGFYISRRVNAPREERGQSRAVSNLNKRIESYVNDEKKTDRTVTRRRFINLATLSQK